MKRDFRERQLFECRDRILALIKAQRAQIKQCDRLLQGHANCEEAITAIEQVMREIEFERYLNTACWRYKC